MFHSLGQQTNKQRVLNLNKEEKEQEEEKK